MTNTLIIRKLGTRDYQTTWEEMRAFTATRSATTNDELWLLEHPHVFTQGRAGKAEHILNPGDVPIIQTDRGGQVTYHGPGQLIIYTLFDIRRAKIGVKQFVHLLEKTMIDVLEDYDIATENHGNAPGIYYRRDGAKICSLGLRITHGCSYHGLALNVTTDLSYFRRINPCGYKNLLVTKMSAFVPYIFIPNERQKLEGKIIKQIMQNFGYTDSVIY